jgi:hypothetical protein
MRSRENPSDIFEIEISNDTKALRDNPSSGVLGRKMSGYPTYQELSLVLLPVNAHMPKADSPG